MVKTRHSGDLDESTLGGFLSLSPRRNRRRTAYVQEINGYDSDELDESIHTPARYRGRTRNRIVIGESISPEDSIREDGELQPVRRSSRKPLAKDEGNPYAKPRYDARSPPRSVRSRRGQPNVEGEPNDYEDIPHELMNGESEVTRRSTRQKRFMYNTFDQHAIGEQLSMLDEIDNQVNSKESLRPLRKRRKVEVDPVPEDEQKEGEAAEGKEMVDMYTRVKRNRRQIKRDMYGMPIQEDEGKSGDSEDEDESESSSSSEEEEEEQGTRGYYLREHKPRTSLYEAPPIEPQRARSTRTNIFRDPSPPRRVQRNPQDSYRSPARKRSNFRRRNRPAFHGDSSETSSSGSSSGGDSADDARRFEKRKSKSMAKARQRCLPMNFTGEDMTTGILRDRQRIGSSLADVDPMTVDRSVSFEHVGGLGKHIRALKEMIVFPLMYPEVFEKFKLAPPRGVLFYGPPGTGKTLVARALANECSQGNKKVAFFMRKGADCLSKWVGESERQLRLLFDQAYQVRPSIIFFDEIDGLAPVRSSRQDQIHSSIVSTLLALMDGLDSRGEVVVIGATNRIDSIDPALRRPGRFDREFNFPLPSREARQQIVKINTSAWNPKLPDTFLRQLSELCVGYCGADLKALCTEAALHALRRRYPQIYTSNDKLQLDVSSINVAAKDFQHAMQNIVPAAQRAVASPGRPLSGAIRPLLQATLDRTLQQIQKAFPLTLANRNSMDLPGAAASNNSVDNSTADIDADLYSDDADDEDDGPLVYDPLAGRNRKTAEIKNERIFLDFSSCGVRQPSTHRPRLLLMGEKEQGQSSHIAPAVIHHLERMPVHTLDLPALYGVSARTPEESCAQIFREACRSSPSIIYLPHLCQWWEVIADTLRATFITLLQDLQPNSPILLLATSEEPYVELPSVLKSLFDNRAGEVIPMTNPSERERREYFAKLLLTEAIKGPSSKKTAAKRLLEVLPKAPPPAPHKLTESELKKLHQEEENTLRELRLFLRDTLNKLGRDRKFVIFAKPVDEEEVPDYYEVIANPMDLSTMMSKIDLHKYTTVKEFMADIDLICSNALEYNPDRDPQDRAIRHRACALRDASQSLMTAQLDPDFEKHCEEIADARTRRGESSSVTVPSYYYARPADKYQPGVRKELLEIPANYPSRYSRRARGMAADEEKRNANPGSEQTEENVELDKEPVKEPEFTLVMKKVAVKRSANMPSWKAKSPWLKSSKKRFRKVYYYMDKFGNLFPAEDINKTKAEDPGLKEDNQEKQSDTETKDSANTKDEEISETSHQMDIKSDSTKTLPEQSDTKDTDKVEQTLVNGVLDSEDEESDKVPAGTKTGHRPSRNNSPRNMRSAGNSPARVAGSSPARVAGSSPARVAGSSPARVAGSSPGRQLSSVSKAALHSPGQAKVTSPARASGTSPGKSPSQGCDKSSKTQEPPSTITRTDPPQENSGSLTSIHRTRSKSQSEAEPMDTEPSTSTVVKPNPTTPTTPTPSDKDGEKDDNRQKKPNHKIAGLDEKGNKEKEPEVAQPRVTRSQVPTAQTKRATEILNESIPDLVVDMDRLRHLLATTVVDTADYSVGKLERLYSLLSQCVYSHRRDYNKTVLIEEMENIVKNFTSQQC